MPAYIQHALRARSFMDACRARPDYGQSNYLGCIVRAKRPAQMLEEREGRERYYEDEMAAQVAKPRDPV